MPNCNEKMSDSPVDAHPEPEGKSSLAEFVGPQAKMGKICG